MKEKLTGVSRHLTLRQLRAFSTILRSGTVAATAQALGLTAPAVSLQLKQLEEHVGMPLFERGKEGFRPTAAGLELEIAAERIARSLADFEAAAAALAGLHRGRAVIAVVSTAKYFAPRALAAFKRTRPTIEVALTVGNREATIAALEDPAVDFVLMGRPPEGLEVEAEVLGPHPHVVVAAPNHPLARHTDIAPKALAQEPFLVREAGSGTRAVTEELFMAVGAVPPIAMKIASNETIKQAVMAGLGVALISAHTIAAERREGRIAVLDVQGLPIVRQWRIVKRKDKRFLPAARALWRFLANDGRLFLPEG